MRRALPAVVGAVLIGVAAPLDAVPRRAPVSADPVSSARAALRSGRYEDALRQAAAHAEKQPAAIASTIIAARAEMTLGRTAEARNRLLAAIGRAPDDQALRAALMRVLDDIGDRAALKAAVDRTYADWTDKRVDRKNESDMLAVAIAARLDNNWQDARDVLVELTDARKDAREALIELGAIRLAKYEVEAAVSAFRAVLEIDPQDPDAHAGFARAALDRGYDAAEAEKHITAALDVNPRHAGALAIAGEMALDGEDFAQVEDIVRRMRKTNLRDGGAAFLAAARAKLLDDRVGWERERAARLADRPGDGDFFARAAEALVHQRRYDDARAVAEEGVALDASHAGCLASLGTTLLRLGLEKEGLDALRRAWKRDPYNVRTYNLLNLFEKVIPARYVEVATAHLRFRIEPSAKPAIESVVAPFLESTYAGYARKYRIEPPGPIVIELYGDPQHYAVRTVGLPALAVQGVCFGRVITSQAPGNGAFNWGMVLAHELAHVFAIHISRGRVPRWFTEGLSEVETMRLRPEWSRHADRELWAAMKAGSLPPLAELSRSFILARSPVEAMRAYAHAAAAMDFLERRFGFAKVRAALEAFGRGERGAPVLEALSGMKPDALDRAFRADLASRTARFDRQFLPAEMARAARGTSAAKPPGEGADAGTIAAVGMARLDRGDLPAARDLLRRAELARDARQHPLVMFLAGEIALRAKDAVLAGQSFQALLDLGLDGYDVRVRAALAAVHRKDAKAAETHLRRAIEMDPDSVEPHALLAEMYGDHGKRDERLGEIAAVLRLEPQNRKLAKELVLGAARAAQPARVAEFAPTAIFIDPAGADMHAAWGHALAATGRKADAARQIELALLFGSPDAPALRATLANLYDALGDRKKAAAHRAAGAPATGPPAD